MASWRPRSATTWSRRILGADQVDEAGIAAQRERVVGAAKRTARGADRPGAQPTARALADALVRKSVWIVGGDGWAYDIGFGGLDHVLASGRNVNMLVLDTEVYSNTGGQASKSTPRGAVAKFAAGGKAAAKKDLGLIAMTYGNVYVAQRGASAPTTRRRSRRSSRRRPTRPVADHRLQPLHRARHRDVDRDGATRRGGERSGYWPLYRYDPRLEQEPQLKLARAEDAGEHLHRRRRSPFHASCSDKPGRSCRTRAEQHDVPTTLAPVRAPREHAAVSWSSAADKTEKTPTKNPAQREPGREQMPA